MPRGYLSTRNTGRNPLSNIWSNNGTWWCHYTLTWDHKARRIRRSLKTSDLATAIARRDELFARIAQEGEEVPDRRPRRKDRDEEEQPMLTIVA